MKHRLAVNILMALWALCATRLAYAATFAQEIRGFDWESLLWGAAAGLLGGALRTIFTLANDNRVVFSVLKEARKDMVVSFLAGGFAYALCVAIESKWPGTVTREIRMLAIVGAGWTRAAIFTRAGQFLRSKLDAENQKLRAGLPNDPPSSAAVPLGDK